MTVELGKMRTEQHAQTQYQEERGVGEGKGMPDDITHSTREADEGTRAPGKGIVRSQSMWVIDTPKAREILQSLNDLIKENFPKIKED